MNRVNRLLSILLLSFFIVPFQSCDISDFGDTNVNPNTTTVPITSALLTNSILHLGRTPTLPGMFCQYFSQSQYTDNSRYARVEYGFRDYSNVLYDLQNIVINNSDPALMDAALSNGSQHNQIAVARILKAYFFSGITDRIGDVPYFEALQGDPMPAYDTQESIYRDLFRELAEAVEQFDGGLPAKGDVLFYGEIAKWKKFANTLRLLLALRVSEADPVLGKEQAVAALAADGGVIADNEDNAVLEYPGDAFRNPWFWVYNGGQFIAVSDVMVSFLKDRNDPRLFVYGTPGNSGEVIGVPYGVPREQAIDFITEFPDWALVLAPQWRQPDSPFAILTAADSYLARAEAAALGWTGEDAAALYRLGIQASMQWWQVYDPTEFESYMQEPLVGISGNDALEKIRMQRYFSFYPNGYQGWSIWRRTGVPQLEPTPYAVNSSGQIPRRYVYQPSEANLNPEHYQTAVERMGGDTMDGRVWWDKR